MRQIILSLLCILGAEFFLLPVVTGNDGQTQFYCLDMSCHDVISIGKTLFAYPGKTEKHLSVKKNEDIAILSKPTNKDGDDWVGKVKGKIGIVPKNVVQEQRMNKPTHPEIYKYPLEYLPLWNDPPPHLEPEKNPNEDDEDDDEDGEDFMDDEEESEENNSDISIEKTTLSPLWTEKVKDEPPQIKEEHAAVDDNKDADINTSEPPKDSSSTTPSTEESASLSETKSQDESLDAKSEEENGVEINNIISENQTTLLPSSSEKTEDVPVLQNNEEQDSVDSEKNVEVTTAESVQEQSSSTTITTEESSDLLEANEISKDTNADMSSENSFYSKSPLQSINENDSSDGMKDIESSTEQPSQEQLSTTQPDADSIQAKESSQEVNVDSTAANLDGGELNNVSEEQTTLPPLPVEIIEDIPELPTINEQDSVNDRKDAETNTEEPVLEQSSSTTSTIPTTEESTLPTTESSLDATTDTKDENFGILENSSEIKNTDSQDQTIVSPVLTEEVQLQTNVEQVSVDDKSDVEAITQDTPQEKSSSITQPTEEPVGIPEMADTTQNGKLDSTIDFEKVKNYLEMDKEVLPNEKTLFTPWTEKLEDVSVLQTNNELGSTDDEKILETNANNESSQELLSTIATTTLPTESANANVVPTTETSQHVEAVDPALSVHDHKYEDGSIHDHSHQHNHGHSHSHNHYQSSSNESSSIILVIKHLSSTLLSFLPEHLQDTILDVDDALVFTGIIALTLVSICVPYFFIEGFLSVRPLKKKVVELNKSLWKVSTAYENQQEEFEIFKKKALDYDEDKKRVEQLEAELSIVKNLEGKQKLQVKNLKKQLQSSAKIASEVEDLVESTMDEKTKAVEERDKLKTVVMSLQEALSKTTEELELAQADASTYSIDLELANHTTNNLTMKLSAAENEMEELRAKLKAEVNTRQKVEEDYEAVTEEKQVLRDELADLKDILHKYEETVSNLNQEISQKENELMILKDSLGEDSPLVDIAETKAKLKCAEEESTASQSRIDSLTLEKNSLTRDLQRTNTTLKSIQTEKDQASNRLTVLEAWFKEKEEELRTAVSKYEAERSIRGKDKDDLVKMIEEKSDEVADLTDRLEALKDEFEDTKIQHRTEIRSLEAKSHENWLSLCQAERKAQDARKDAELLRQNLTAITKEKGGDENDVQNTNGEVPFYLPPEMVPLPIPEIPPSYFGLGDDFLPPPPLPLDGEREPLRPPPLGRLSPTWNSDLEDNPLSPIRRRGRRDYSDGSSRSGSRSPPRGPPSSRGNWSERDRQSHHEFRRNDLAGSSSGHSHTHGPKTSSPIQFGANL